MENTKEEMAELENIIAEAFDKEDSNGDYQKYIELASYHVTYAKDIKDYVIALDYANKAVKHGYMEGYYILGQLYYYGTGCEQNLVRSLKYFTKFVEKYRDNDFQNSKAIADAYKNLALGFFKLGMYDRALKYYHILQTVDSELADSMDDLEIEIANIQKENGLKYLKVALGFLLICFGILYISTKYGDSIRAFFTPSRSVVSVVVKEDTSSTLHSYELDASEKKEINEDNQENLFELVDANTFFDNDLKEIYALNIWASSEYISSVGVDYSANCMIDADEETAWQEGTSGGGIGECIHFDFSGEVSIYGFSILNGKTITKDDYYNNNRLASFEIIPENQDDTITVSLEDIFGKQYIILDKPVTTSSIDIIIESVFSGLRFDDTCVTEIQFFE